MKEAGRGVVGKKMGFGLRFQQYIVLPRARNDTHCWPCDRDESRVNPCLVNSCVSRDKIESFPASLGTRAVGKMKGFSLIKDQGYSSEKAVFMISRYCLLLSLRLK